jgi:hypothetical protein
MKNLSTSRLMLCCINFSSSFWSPNDENNYKTKKTKQQGLALFFSYHLVLRGAPANSALNTLIGV